MKIPAINIMVFGFKLSPQEAKNIPAGDKSLLLARKPEGMTLEEYLDSLARRVPAGMTVYIGMEQETIQLRPEDAIACRRFPLFMCHNFRYVLLFTEDMDGEVYFGDEVKRLCDIRDEADAEMCHFGLVYVLDLSDSASGVLNIGNTTVCFQVSLPHAKLELGSVLDDEGVVPPANQENYQAGMARRKAAQEARLREQHRAEIAAKRQEIAAQEEKIATLLRTPVRHLSNATEDEILVMEQDYDNEIKEARGLLATLNSELQILLHPLTPPSIPQGGWQDPHPQPAPIH